MFLAEYKKGIVVMQEYEVGKMFEELQNGHEKVSISLAEVDLEYRECSILRNTGCVCSVVGV